MGQRRSRSSPEAVPDRLPTWSRPRPRRRTGWPGRIRGSGARSCLRLEHLIGFLQLPAEMIHVEQHHGLRIGVLELFVYAPLPAVGEALRAVDILGEESFFIGDSELVEHGLDHV